jgi:hypothetical protein
VRDGVPLVKRDRTEWRGEGGEGEEGPDDHDGCESASLPRRHLGIRGCEVKTDGNGLLRNLWSGYAQLAAGGEGGGTAR